ncbi:MAG: glutathione S-transferase family protein [Alphaproteobacteria bacterium]
MYKLLGRKTSGNVQKVVWFFEERGLDYIREDYGRQFGNTTDQAYLDLNPNAKVPTLVDGDTVVWESNTILRYLCNRTDDATLYPADPAARSLVERWMDWQLGALNGPYMEIFRATKKPEEERDAAAIATHSAAMATQLSILDGALAGDNWLVGNEFSLAEISLGPIVHRCLGFPIELPALAALRAWDERYTGRPAFKTATG